MLTVLDLRSQTASGRSDSVPRPRGLGGSRIVSEETATTVEHVRAAGRGARPSGAGQRDLFDRRHQPLDPDLPARAWASLSSRSLGRLQGVADRIRSDCFLATEQERDRELSPGIRVARHRVAAERVGLYFPSGTTTGSTVASLLWYALCAKAAGARSIAVAFDPQPHEHLDQLVLAACHTAGVQEVYSVGGAEAIAVFAYGSGGCGPVDLIAGPDDQGSGEAKSIVCSEVRVLYEAGPRAFAIVADRWANPTLVADDIVDVAEGASLRDLFLVTPGEGFAEDVAAAVHARYRLSRPRADHAQADPASLATVVLVDDMEHALAVADSGVASHVSIHSAYGWSYGARIRRAEAVYVGAHSPFALRRLGLVRPLVSTSPEGASPREVSPDTFRHDVQVVHCTRHGLESLSNQ